MHDPCAACVSASSCALHEMSSVEQMYNDLVMAKALLDKGIFSQEEYEKEKRFIMDRRALSSKARHAASAPRPSAVVTFKCAKAVSPATAPASAASASTNGTGDIQG